MFDAQTLQTIGALATPITGLAAFTYGWLRRKRLTSWFSMRATLIAERSQAIAERDGALREARTAEAANKNQSDSIVALQTSLKTLQATVDDLQAKLEAHQAKVMPMQEKIDALVDWAHLTIDYILYLEDNVAKVPGFVRDRFMPKIPPSLADRFNIPETLRDA